MEEDDNEELERLLRQRVADQEVIDGERELSALRSGGSAPPTADQLLGAAFLGDNDVYEKCRSDPAYSQYYYDNVKRDPRLPLPLPEKQDMRSTRSVIGDRRIMNNGGGESLFSVQPVFGRAKEELNMHETWNNEWKRDGLIGLPGLALRDRQKGIADVVQDEIANATSVSRYPVGPASFAYEDTEYSGSHAAPHNKFSSLNALHSDMNVQGSSSLQSISSSLPQTYASALDGSLSKNATPGPQIIAELSSNHMPVVGGAGRSSLYRKNLNAPKFRYEVSPDFSASAGLDAALLGLSLSSDSVVDEGRHPTPQMQEEIGIQHNPHLQMNQNPINQFPYLNKNLKRPSPPIPICEGSSPSHNIASPSSSLSNYWFDGCPRSSSMFRNQEAGGKVSPLTENVAARAALGTPGVEPRALQGGLTLGSNLLYAIALHNCYRDANHDSQHALPMNLVDPSYLQYFSENAALNDLIRNRGCRGSSCLSSGQPCRLSNGFPDSSILIGGPVRPAEQYMHNSSGLRNAAGNFMGPWPSEPGTNLEQHFASLLDEIKGNKTRCFGLGEIAGHVVEFSMDLYGNLFIQQKLETASTEEKNMGFHEIMPQALSLMTDVYGNYVIRKFFEYGNASQIRQLAEQLTGNFLTLSFKKYGSLVIQKAIEVLEQNQQVRMVRELDGHIMLCVRNRYANYVIQKCIQSVPEAASYFILTTFVDQVVALSTHPYGCLVIKRVLDHCRDPTTHSIVMNEILQSVCMLSEDQYGYFVIQHLLENGKPHERSAIINQLIGKTVQMNQQKFSSIVIRKCLSFGTPEERQRVVNEILGSSDEHEPLQKMLENKFKLYVLRKVLETCDDQQLRLILDRVKVHLNALRKHTYGIHSVAQIDKLVAAGERMIRHRKKGFRILHRKALEEKCI